MWPSYSRKPILKELECLVRVATAKFMAKAKSRYSKTISLLVAAVVTRRRPRHCRQPIMHYGRVSVDAV